MVHFRDWDTAAPAGQVWHIAAQAGRHLVLPDGVLDLVWTDGELVFCGPDTAAAQVMYDDATSIWGHRFAPGWATQLTGIPAAELINERLDAAEYLGLTTAQIDAVAADPRGGLNAVVRALWNRANVSADDEATLTLAASVNRAAAAGLRVPAIATAHHLSERTLRRFCHQWFGYGPKTLASVLRFQQALELARDGLSLTAVAARCGYADQAHLARESQRLTGLAPTELLTFGAFA